MTTVELRRTTYRPVDAAAATRPPKRTIRRVVGTASVLFGAIVLGLLGTGGTYAYLNSQTSVDAGTVTAGSMNLTVDGRSAARLDTSGWSALLPGQAARATFTVSNVGNVPAAVSGQIAVVGSNLALANHLTLTLSRQANGICSVHPISAQLSTFNSAASPLSFAAGETATLCVTVVLDEDAPTSVRNSALNFRLDLNSVQKVGP